MTSFPMDIQKLQLSPWLHPKPIIPEDSTHIQQFFPDDEIERTSHLFPEFSTSDYQIGISDDYKAMFSLKLKSRKVHSKPPILTKTGYKCSPSIDDLKKLPAEKLRSIQNFTISRPGIGKIEFPGSTDVTNLNLNSIVKIRRNFISLYDNQPLPAIGSGLNKLAVLSINTPLPKYVSLFDFTLKLKKKCVEKNWKFISYDSQVWKFETQSVA